MLRSRAQRGVSKHEGLAAPSFETGAARPPQDEAAARMPNSRLVAEPFSLIPISRCQTAQIVSFPRRVCVRVLPLMFTHPEPKGGRSAEGRILLSLSRRLGRE